MRRLSVAIALAILIPTLHVAAENIDLTIESPAEGSKVPEQPTVTGTVEDVDGTIWIVVHPPGDDYWIQAPATAHADGSWESRIHVGRPGTIDVGKRFEIRAVANPEGKLEQGLVLHNWPKAEAQSKVVAVIRE